MGEEFKTKKEAKASFLMAAPRRVELLYQA